MPNPVDMEWTPERVQRFWDYESAHPERYFTYTRSASLVRRVRSHITPGDRLLDYGCGRGFLVEKLLETGNAVTAADHSPQSVARVGEQYSGKAGFEGAFTVDTLEEKGERFDVIFVIEVIEHLTDEALETLFDRVARVAAPGARLVITTPNQEKLAKKQVYCPACNHTFHRWGHVRQWSDVSLGAYLEGRGWTVREAVVTNFAKLIPGRPWKSLWNRIEAATTLKKSNLAMVCTLRDAG